MPKRLVRKLTDVAAEVERQLRAHYDVTEKDLTVWRVAARLKDSFPNCTMQSIGDLWIDYEVQRDVLHKHIINIMRKWDSRICSPVSACRLVDNNRIETYDGQHRTIAATILGFKEIPCAVVTTDDKNFASYAFEMLNDTGVKRLTPGDLHRNALVRYKNGSRDVKVVRARVMQDQFDKLGVDLQDKNSRNSESLCGDNEYYMSHFKYAQKAIEIDDTGNTLYNILAAITTVFEKQEEIDQGVFIGLYELHRISSINPADRLPNDWMTTLLESIKPTFKSSHILHDKAKKQWAHVKPGSTWSAPSAMSNFMRELHIISGGELKLPYHGEGAKMGIEEGNAAAGLFPKVQ